MRGLVYLQGKSCVIHTWALLGLSSHEEVLYKCSAFSYLPRIWYGASLYPTNRTSQNLVQSALREQMAERANCTLDLSCWSTTMVIACIKRFEHLLDKNFNGEYFTFTSYNYISLCKYSSDAQTSDNCILLAISLRWLLCVVYFALQARYTADINDNNCKT